MGVTSRESQPMRLYRAFYNEDTFSPEKGETTYQVIVCTSYSDFTRQDIEELKAKHGVQNILVDEVLEYI